MRLDDYRNEACRGYSHAPNFQGCGLHPCHLPNSTEADERTAMIGHWKQQQALSLLTVSSKLGRIRRKISTEALSTLSRVVPFTTRNAGTPVLIPYPLSTCIKGPLVLHYPRSSLHSEPASPIMNMNFELGSGFGLNFKTPQSSWTV